MIRIRNIAWRNRERKSHCSYCGTSRFLEVGKNYQCFFVTILCLCPLLPRDHACSVHARRPEEGLADPRPAARCPLPAARSTWVGSKAVFCRRALTTTSTWTIRFGRSGAMSRRSTWRSWGSGTHVLTILGLDRLRACLARRSLNGTAALIAAVIRADDHASSRRYAATGPDEPIPNN